MSDVNIFDRLRADHERVRGEMVMLEQAAGIVPSAIPSGPSLHPLLDGLRREFEIHMKAEDEVLFPLLLRGLPQLLGQLESLAVEHGELRGMLGALLEVVDRPGSAARDEQIAVQLRDFVDLLRIHLRKEEAVVFRVAERLLAPADVQNVAEHMARSDSQARNDASRMKGNAG
jgi:hemerythrin-like domain-containing protein